MDNEIVNEVYLANNMNRADLSPDDKKNIMKRYINNPECFNLTPEQKQRVLRILDLYVERNNILDVFQEFAFFLSQIDIDSGLNPEEGIAAEEAPVELNNHIVGQGRKKRKSIRKKIKSKKNKKSKKSRKSKKIRN